MHRLRRDDGVTLTEVLVSVVVLGIIMGPLTLAVIQFIRLSDDVTKRLNESHDAQLAAAYFAQDVQSIGTRDWSAFPYLLRPSIETNVGPTAGTYPCGATSLPNAVVRFAWDDPQSATGVPPVVRVSYVVMVVGTERQLHRVTCVGSGPGPQPSTSDIIVARYLDAAPGPPVCAPTACTDVGATSVALTLDIRAPGSTGTALRITLSGHRRQT